MIFAELAVIITIVFGVFFIIYVYCVAILILVISRLGVRFLSPAPEIFAAKFCGVLIFPTAKKVEKKVLTTRI